MKAKMKRSLQLLAENGLNMFVLSVLTGLFAGVIVTLYNVLISIGERKSVELYAWFGQNPALIPVLLVGLAAGGVVIGTLVRFVPMIRGSGIPQIEGAARGIIRFKWYVTMCSMFAASLACVFMGLSAGSEGPSLEIGGCAGGAVGTLLKRNQMVKRLQIAGGASAGLAVAFNAPVTGMVFALEEAFRSFSPQVFICAAISVATALFTRNAIRPALGYGTGFAFEGFVFCEFDGKACLWTALAALITALVGVGFYYLVFAVKRMFKRVTFLKGAGKYMIPFVLAGAFGLITAYSMGGGHAFIDALATGGSGKVEIERVLGAGLIASLVIVVVIRFVTAVLSMGCGVPCGVFIPMLAIGAGVGALLSTLFQQAGMNGEYGDYLVMICMSVFFTTVVKAPITGLVMIFELTGQFYNLLPPLIGITIGYLVGLAFRTEPIYEKCLALYIREEKLYEKVEKIRVRVAVMPDSKADGRAVRTVIWPTNGLVVEVIASDGKSMVPDGETVLHAGQELVFECETDSREQLLDYLYAIVGKPEPAAV